MKKYINDLLKWFEENKRNLEWRIQPSAYTILVSEIMLQQTRAQAVRPYYIRFIQELPDFFSLANCEEEKLLKLWEGLGYYSRVRNLQKCAKEIVNKYNGFFPKQYNDAIRLPGIGAYTCGAILSRAYNLKYAAVDGNVLRALSRYYCDSSDILKDSTKKLYKQKLEKILPENAGKFNESMMELGATICMPKKTLCDSCPLSKGCKAYKNNLQFNFPKKQEKKEKKIYEYTCLFLTDGNKYHLTSKKEGVLKGLASPILIPHFLTGIDAIEYLSSLGYHAIHEIQLLDKKHIFTHQIWYMKAYKILIPTSELKEGYTKEELLNKISIPSCFKQFLGELLD